MKDFKGVPIARIRSVLEKAEAILKSLENAGNSSQARMLHSFVSAYVTLGDLDEAHDRAGRSLAIMQDLVAENPENPRRQRDLATARNKLGGVLEAKGDMASAEKAYRTSLAIRERLAGSDPANAEWQADFAASHGNLGQLMLTVHTAIKTVTLSFRKERCQIRSELLQASGKRRHGCTDQFKTPKLPPQLSEHRLLHISAAGQSSLTHLSFFFIMQSRTATKFPDCMALDIVASQDHIAKSSHPPGLYVSSQYFLQPLSGHPSGAAFADLANKKGAIRLTANAVFPVFISLPPMNVRRAGAMCWSMNSY